VLAAGQIRGDLQAHLALPRAGEEPPLVDADLAPGPDETQKLRVAGVSLVAA
jgi:hypothetical protein